MTTLASIESQILENQKKTSYQPINRPTSYIVDEFLKGNIVVPKFQREFRWDTKQQSRFIESHVIGLPIPSIFIATNEHGKREIVDGSQRIRTLVSFLCSEEQLKDLNSGEYGKTNTKLHKLKLEGLEKLTSLNKKSFSDLPIAEQEDFRGRGMRINVLDKHVSSASKVWIFERINTQSYDLTPMEKRIGVYDGIFIGNLLELAESKKFIDLLSRSSDSKKEKILPELLLRFLAYFEYFTQTITIRYTGEPNSFLNEYTKTNQNKKISKKIETIFNKTLDFIEIHYKDGLIKKVPGKKSSYSNARFEAIMIGSALALESNETIYTDKIDDWLYSDEFLRIVSSDAANNVSKVKDRILFVKNKLLRQNYILEGSYNK